ncbi:hypothetical protein BJY04DRAFT_223084 [Aspergillus karnatakaensis]|uniref:uncharacterized protein n=1 Tax=Aspergillus karnatakaensis TaxID=1810916 RepID=UPI003CCD62CD
MKPTSPTTLLLGLSLVLTAFPLVFAAGSSSSSTTTSTSTDTTTTSSSTPSSTPTQQTTCYNLNGSIAPNHVPCGTGAVVNCCHESDICMSNGLCFQQGERGMVLGRGSCSDSAWGKRCFAPCPDYNRDGDIAIVNMGFDTGESEYCCGGVVPSKQEEGGLMCEYGGPFTVDSGTAVVGFAGLAEDESDSDDDSDSDDEQDDDSVSDSDSDSDSDSSEDDDEEDEDDNEVSPALAIALGVGIPLGLASMGLILWAVWERRRRQLQREEEERGDTMMTPLNLSERNLSLHHRYGPISSPAPTYSARGTPNASGILYSVQGQSGNLNASAGAGGPGTPLERTMSASMSPAATGAEAGVGAAQSPPRVTERHPLHGVGVTFQDIERRGTR